MEFLELPETEQEPILCGYFSRVLGVLLRRQKVNMLEYLLLEREGLIFDNLLKNNSLSTLLLDMLSLKLSASEMGPTSV